MMTEIDITMLLVKELITGLILGVIIGYLICDIKNDQRKIKEKARKDKE